LTHAQIQARHGREFAAWRADPWHASPPGGETLAEIVARVQTAFDDLAAGHDDETVLLVAHGGTLRLLITLALGLPPETQWRFRVDLASISELMLQEGGVVLNRLNDTTHLENGIADDPVAQLVLVLGGARSGKSTFAQQMAARWGGDRVLFVATAEVGDEEMRRRVAAHLRERPAAWRTVEAPRDVARGVAGHLDGVEVVLLDCLTVLVSNLLLAHSDPFDPAARAGVLAEVEAIVSRARETPACWIVVSNEVGAGLVPPSPVGRSYRDLLGLANQRLAQEADQVTLLVAGVPMRVK